ncbi:capsular polysaccharide biosynthesis protein [Parapedobacter defluvii]|uniref:Capsular polysaccharide biosynthesis protein n=2 Tax=Parapedobacter defluvii TaxID=2045106 RepID=A0ABQ1MWB1_9SPHI|nr:capsular polysaccharide biosynthesis protein [Parapedobacter defluvii]
MNIMIRETQIQQVAYNVDNSLYELITYQPPFRIDLQAVKRKLLVYQETIFLKRVFDIVFSALVIVAGLPVYALLALITKITSPGPVFYRQERIGKDQKPFYIYKFRSMRVDAEQAGPQLASDDDPRITKWGKFMRKTHLDELPQFWNVLKGDMAIVGPRPERRHFIDEIKERKPEYMQLFRLKPGITSIGQVYYGYAENVNQMCERVNYDLDYLSTMSLKTDLDIILQTVKVMAQGKGK